ncbi:MAG: hypothetical protein NZM31_04065 [Gemmatales bacterium]|nr:hypothetical protein [Gemmatales bacterium]MDW8386175.1 hypothetical protein [Gemmatales bacterium]
MKFLRYAVVLGLTAVLLASGFAQPPTPSLAGNWKITVLPRGAEFTLWLVQIREVQGKPQATLLAAGPPEFKASRIVDTQLDGNSLRLTIEANGVVYSVVGYVPQGMTRPMLLPGSVGALGRRDLARLERTDARELTPETSQVLGGPAWEAFEKAFTTADPKERETRFQEIVTQYNSQPVAFHALMHLVEHVAQYETSVETARDRAEKAVKLAAGYGREMELQTLVQLTLLLAKSPRTAPMAVEFGRKAEKMFTPSDPLLLQARWARLLSRALKATGAEAEARSLEERLASLNAKLDEEYLQTALPFAPEKYRGRKGRSDRVVLVELFTGTQCPPCIAADLACDALHQTYTPLEVIVLEYHLHIPGPDPLTCPDSERRAVYYQVEATPLVLINGQEGPPVFGYRPQARERYRALRNLLDQRLETEAGAKLELSTQMRDGLLEIKADYSGLKRPAETTRLRLAVVEERVRYAAPDGRRFHYNVLRGFAGGADGAALKAPSGSHAASVNLADMRQGLSRYLQEMAKVVRFPDEEMPLDLRRLRVIGFIQDDKTREILQAAQADVAAADGGSKP